MTTGALHGTRTGPPYILARRCSKARTETPSLSSTRPHVFTGLSVFHEGASIACRLVHSPCSLDTLYNSLYPSIHTIKSTLIVISAACSATSYQQHSSQLSFGPVYQQFETVWVTSCIHPRSHCDTCSIACIFLGTGLWTCMTGRKSRSSHVDQRHDRNRSPLSLAHSASKALDDQPVSSFHSTRNSLPDCSIVQGLQRSYVELFIQRRVHSRQGLYSRDLATVRSKPSI